MNDKGQIITIIGAGNMGTAILAGIVRNGLTDPELVRATGLRREHLDAIHREYGVTTMLDNPAAIEGADVVMLCVKPQHLEQVLQELDNRLHPKTLVISIVAGARLERLQAGLNHGCIIRTMPNTPAQIGQGKGSPAITPVDRADQGKEG
mgnify:CR=1 FL=1